MKLFIGIAFALFSILSSAKDICYKDGDIRCYSEIQVDNLEIITDYIQYVEVNGIRYKITETAESITIEVIEE